MRARAVFITSLSLALLAGCEPTTSTETDGQTGTPLGDLQILAVSPEETHVLTLTCFPVSGSHPNPVHACSVLDNVDGDITNIEPRPVSCPDVAEQTWVAVSGQWAGQMIQEAFTFDNECLAREATHGVLDFR